jgi:signal transduction histidine kinase
VQLTDFRLFNEETALDTAISAIKTLRLDHHQNFFSFKFAALDFTNPKQNHYTYKMEGFDADWIASGNKSEASYTNVPPGEYTFRVKGSNDDGVWNEKGASVKIVIHPPYWQTWWFRALVALAVIGILAFVYNYRVSKLLEIERTRLRIARDLHDEVGSSLSSIALTAELLQKELVTNGVVSRQLTRVHDTAEKLTRTLKEIVWAIDPQKDKLDDLLLRMREVATELLTPCQISCAFHFSEKGMMDRLPMEFRRNLYMIYKESLHNICKHSRATHVDINLTRSAGLLTLKIADNGYGFDPATAKNGQGLKSVQARAHELRGHITMKSRPGEGTEFTLIAKIP